MKTIRQILPLLVVCIIIATTPIYAAEIESPRFQKALGFQAGQLSGLGLSYQEWKGDTGYQVAAGIMYFPVSEYSYRLLDYSIGIELQSSLYYDSFSTWLSGGLYLFAALNHQGYINMIDPNPNDSVYESVVGPFEAVIGLGGGIGVEATLFDHFSIVLELGYGVFWTPTKAKLLEQFSVNIVPQVGLRYRY